MFSHPLELGCWNGMFTFVWKRLWKLVKRSGSFGIKDELFPRVFPGSSAWSGMPRGPDLLGRFHMLHNNLGSLACS
jgi:hypothetical protein